MTPLCLTPPQTPSTLPPLRANPASSLPLPSQSQSPFSTYLSAFHPHPWVRLNFLFRDTISSKIQTDPPPLQPWLPSLPLPLLPSLFWSAAACPPLCPIPPQTPSTLPPRRANPASSLPLPSPFSTYLSAADPHPWVRLNFLFRDTISPKIQTDPPPLQPWFAFSPAFALAFAFALQLETRLPPLPHPRHLSQSTVLYVQS